MARQRNDVSYNLASISELPDGDRCHITASLIVKRCDLSSVEEIKRWFPTVVSKANNSVTLNFEVVDSESGSHKLDAIILFSLLMALSKRNEGLSAILFLRNNFADAMRFAIMKKNTILGMTHEPKMETGTILVTVEIRALLKLSGFPINDSAERANLTQEEQSRCIKFLLDYTGKKGRTKSA